MTQEWKNIVDDAKKLCGSITVGIKKVIEHYQNKPTDSENKPTDSVNRSAEAEKPTTTPPPIEMPIEDSESKPVKAPPEEPVTPKNEHPTPTPLDHEANDNKPENKE